MQKLEDTPRRIARRKYEATTRKKNRKEKGNFSTWLDRKDYIEINTFLRENRITKVSLICRGYLALRKDLKNTQ